REVALDRADVAPIRLALGLARNMILREIIGKDARAGRDEPGDDVAPEIVPRAALRALVAEHALEHVAPADVLAPPDERPAGPAGDLGRVLRLLDAPDDAPARVDVDDAERARLARRHRERGDGQIRLLLAVHRLHLLDVHLVDVVAAEDANVLRARVAH